jgi:ATP-dependent Lhr-like helicase
VTGRDLKRARVQFFPRGQGSVFLPSPDLSGLSEPAQSVYTYLKEEGASPISDMEAVLRLAPEAIRSALVELALAGLATADSIAALRAVLGYQPPETEPRIPLSTLEAELAHKRIHPPLPGRRGDRGLHRAARRRVELRLAQEADAAAIPAQADPWGGRWSLLHRAGVLGPARSEEETGALWAQTLLARYGVLTREAVAREELPLEWAAIAGHLARMEMRGEVRRGYFVKGRWGVQYALPEAVEQLRAAGEPQGDGTFVVLNAADPAQVYGASAPAENVTADSAEEGSAGDPPRFARLPSTHVIMRQGRVMLLAEDGGERMWAPGDAPPEQIQDAVRAYLARPGAARRVSLALWNGQPALGSAAQEILRPLGFHRTPGGLEWRKPV